MLNENPKTWRFTWEAQSHSPMLKLFLFDSHTNPLVHCYDLEVSLNLSQSQVLVTWIRQQQEDTQNQVSLSIPVPRVLIDTESPVNYRALNDHIEVKLVLLLPVDHPIVSSFDYALRLSEEAEVSASDMVKPLAMDSDLKGLSLKEEVHFYCRSCSTRLTRNSIRHFKEMPSVNWQDVADNWFGGCCCSFGGISETLVNKYVNSYICLTGMCLLTYATVTLFKDDLIGSKFTDWDVDGKLHPGLDSSGVDGLNESAVNSRSDNGGTAAYNGRSVRESGIRSRKNRFNSNPMYEVNESEAEANEISSESPKDVASVPGCCAHTCQVTDHIDEAFEHTVSQPSTLDQNIRNQELMTDQKFFLNGFLGNLFMARSCSLSKDIEWVEFLCPQCSSLVGAYPCSSGRHAPIDGGVRLFKCYTSTCFPVSGSTDIFQRYTLERMFTNQLVESSKDELSFRTVVRDLKTKLPMLQVVLLNPNLWCSTGCCLGADSNTEPIPKLDLQPAVKVLFSNCNDNSDSYSRMIENWLTKNQADEVFMLKHQIEELIELLTSAKLTRPPSCTSIEGFHLSSIRRDAELRCRRGVTGIV